MPSNRLRNMPTEDLVALVVLDLLDAQLHPFRSEVHDRRAQRLYRELSKRTSDSTAHAVECVCEICCRYFNDLEEVWAEFEERS